MGDERWGMGRGGRGGMERGIGDANGVRWRGGVKGWGKVGKGAGKVRGWGSGRVRGGEVGEGGGCKVGSHLLLRV